MTAQPAQPAQPVRPGLARWSLVMLALAVLAVGCSVPGQSTSREGSAPRTGSTTPIVDQRAAEAAGARDTSLAPPPTPGLSPLQRPPAPGAKARLSATPVRPAPAGRLGIRSLGITAPVEAVGTARGAMTVPQSPARVGWLRSTAALPDAIGSSVLSGHVSDRRDVAGPLARLHRIRPGALISWTGPRGLARDFEVVSVRRYPRDKPLPASLFRVLGPRQLHLVTCTDRVTTAGGGFHYTANLVVTARLRVPRGG